ncbi:MAG: hypothetical protein CMJ31_00400 [Phycisphaerae bacterium]|nr:hypothetical protein [Phycisphaerae bacterium]
MLDEVRKLASRTCTGRSKLLRKLDELEAAVSNEIDNLDDARRRRVVGPRARVRAAIYTVEESPRGLALTERRDSKARPFKCPLEIHRAVMEAVAGSASPQTFQQIKATSERSLKESIADYGVRTPLRFWAVLGLVRHDQARFTRVGTKAEFERAARDQWSRARRERIEIEPG